MPILVTGATGTVGRSLVAQLHAAGHRVRTMTRDPGSPAAAFPSGVEVVRGGDFDVHEADIAAIVMRALLDEDHAGRTYQPTGPEPVRRRDAVQLIGDALGREIRFVELTPDEARALWRGVYDDIVIEWFLRMGEYLDSNAWVSPDVAEVTGQRGRTFARWAVEHADDFR